MKRYRITLNFRHGGAIGFILASARSKSRILDGFCDEISKNAWVYLECETNPNGISGVLSEDIISVGVQEVLEEIKPTAGAGANDGNNDAGAAGVELTVRPPPPRGRSWRLRRPTCESPQGGVVPAFVT